MKKIVALSLILVLALSLAACGGSDSSNSDSNSGANTPETAAQSNENATPETESVAAEVSENPAPAEGDELVCTAEAYDEAIDTLYISTGFETMPTYDDVVELFGGVDGTPWTEMENEGYCYYTWTDGHRTAILTFTVSGGEETYFAITGDLS